MSKARLAAALIGLTIAAAAAAAGPFDGRYKGSAALSATRGNAHCDQTIPFTLPVTDSGFTWSVGNERVPVKVGPDGTFSAQNGRRFISGRIAGASLSAKSTGEYCDYTWTLSK